MVRRLLAQNPVRFFLYRRAYLRPLQKAYPAPPEHAPVIEAMRRDGICVIERYLERPAVDEIVAEVLPILSRMREGDKPQGITATSYPEYGTFILHGLEKWTRTAQSFLDDEMIHQVVAALSGGQGTPFETRAELRVEAKRNDFVDDWHADTWKFRMKAMLYLSDVGSASGPLRYLTGSHIGTSWATRRFLYDYLGSYFGDSTSVQRLLVQQAERQSRSGAFRQIVCTAPAGTLILFDTRGLHAATTPREGSRLVLNRGFVLRDELA